MVRASSIGIAVHARTALCNVVSSSLDAAIRSTGTLETGR